MSKYLNWGERTLEDASDIEISLQYDQGFLFTRKNKGNLYCSRSLRINLSQFELNSENRRILNKFPELKIESSQLPLENYNWKIHKLGKDFYASKFDDVTFSAAKIKEMLTRQDKSNFNQLLSYSLVNSTIGYAICYLNSNMMHYAYPFYDHVTYPNNLGMAMMLKAILFSQELSLKYIYLGTLSRPTDQYKLQFKALQWFDGKSWQEEIDKAKQLIKLS